MEELKWDNEIRNLHEIKFKKSYDIQIYRFIEENSIQFSLSFQPYIYKVDIEFDKNVIDNIEINDIKNSIEHEMDKFIMPGFPNYLFNGHVNIMSKKIFNIIQSEKIHYREE